MQMEYNVHGKIGKWKKCTWKFRNSRKKSKGKLRPGKKSK